MLNSYWYIWQYFSLHCWCIQLLPGKKIKSRVSRWQWIKQKEDNAAFCTETMFVSELSHSESFFTSIFNTQYRDCNEKHTGAETYYCSDRQFILHFLLNSHLIVWFIECKKNVMQLCICMHKILNSRAIADRNITAAFSQWRSNLWVMFFCRTHLWIL